LKFFLAEIQLFLLESRFIYKNRDIFCVTLADLRIDGSSSIKASPLQWLCWVENFWGKACSSLVEKPGWLVHEIGLVGKKSPDTPIFHGKNHGSCRHSLKPSQWLVARLLRVVTVTTFRVSRVPFAQGGSWGATAVGVELGLGSHQCGHRGKPLSLIWDSWGSMKIKITKSHAIYFFVDILYTAWPFWWTHWW
jgi:hypothetical protein